MPFPPPYIQVGDGALSRRCSPCHAREFTRVRPRMRPYSPPQFALPPTRSFIPGQLWHHCSQDRYAADADGLEEENFCSRLARLRPVLARSAQNLAR